MIIVFFFFICLVKFEFLQLRLMIFNARRRHLFVVAYFFVVWKLLFLCAPTAIGVKLFKNETQNQFIKKSHICAPQMN